MNPRRAFPFLLSAAIIAGCTTQCENQGEHPTLSHAPRLLSAANPELGAVYELGVYVIAKGDTVALVCRRFQIPVGDFMTMNPDLNRTRLLIGQQVRIRETVKD